MRGVLGAHRGSRPRVVRPAGVGRRRPGHHRGRAAGRRRPAPSGPGGVHRRAGRPVRLLHLRHGDGRGRPAVRPPRPDRAGGAGGPGWQSVPLRDARPDHPRGAEGSRADFRWVSRSPTPAGWASSRQPGSRRGHPARRGPDARTSPACRRVRRAVKRLSAPGRPGGEPGAGPVAGFQPGRGGHDPDREGGVRPGHLDRAGAGGRGGTPGHPGPRPGGLGVHQHQPERGHHGRQLVGPGLRLGAAAGVRAGPRPAAGRRCDQAGGRPCGTGGGRRADPSRRRSDRAELLDAGAAGNAGPVRRCPGAVAAAG